MGAWTVYILRCADDSLYTGIAKDVDRRVAEHNAGQRLGARYTRSRRPVRLVYAETFASRSEAAAREYEIKKLTRQRKQVLLQGGSPRGDPHP